MEAYHIATEEELRELQYPPYADVLIGPEGFECFLGEPEDCRWSRDGKNVVRELNKLHKAIRELRGT